MFKPVVVALLLTFPIAAGAQDRGPRTPAIEGFGAIHPAPEAAEPVSRNLRYRAVFNITAATPAPDQVNPALDRVARFLNLLAEQGVRPRRGDIVAVVHGPATTLVAADRAYAARMSAARNPNLPLIRHLREAGVVIAVCSQALHRHALTRDQVSEDVRIDLSAVTTLANLQLRGYALIPN